MRSRFEIYLFFQFIIVLLLSCNNSQVDSKLSEPKITNADSSIIEFITPIEDQFLKIEDYSDLMNINGFKAFFIESEDFYSFDSSFVLNVDFEDKRKDANIYRLNFQDNLHSKKWFNTIVLNENQSGLKAIFNKPLKTIYIQQNIIYIIEGYKIDRIEIDSLATITFKYEESFTINK